MATGETVDPLFSAEQIDQRLQDLADEIIRDYGDRPLALVCALSGGVMFLADLARKLGNNVSIDFIRASSYGDGMTSSGAVQLISPPKLDLKDKDVLVVEDIIDTGHTIAFLRTYLNELGAASVRVCALLDKPSRREVIDAKADYLGFSIPDEFVVGYGLDYAQRYRNLPYVGILRFN
jgi:hypoxanthine phosphoribosyltransferase